MQNEKNKYVLKCDIRKYFPSIDKEKLKAIIRKKIACQDTLWLIDIIIDSFELPKNNDFFEHCIGKGLPIGNLTSQYFANLYLNDLDHFIKEKLQIKNYIRYVDDFVLLHENKSFLNECKIKIDSFLEDYFLILHPTKSRTMPTKNGITFLGQQVFRTHRLLTSENIRRFYKKLKKNTNLLHKNQISVRKFTASLNSWKGHAQQTDSFRLLESVTKQLEKQGINLIKTYRSAWRFVEQQ